MITKQDYAIAALVGFLAGVFAIPTLLNIGIRSQPILIAVPAIAAVLFYVGIIIGKFLSRFLGFFAQVSKFAAVGFLNTAIDFGVLNLLSMVTGVTGGFTVGGVNMPGFIAAALNGYLWNQLWVFRARSQGESMFHDFPKFLAVTIIGLLINNGIVVFLTLPGMAQTALVPVSGEVGLNIAKVVATVFSMVWNFLGYKLIVFRT